KRPWRFKSSPAHSTLSPRRALSFLDTTRARPGTCLLDVVRRNLYRGGEHTFARPTNPGGGDADGTATGDLGLPRRLRRPPRLSPDRARDRRGRGARIPLDRARAPREPRARGPLAARPDQAARAGARRS